MPAKKKAAAKKVEADDSIKALQGKKVPMLRKMCRDLGIEDCTGLKADLITQILDAQALASEEVEIVIKKPKATRKSVVKPVELIIDVDEDEEPAPKKKVVKKKTPVKKTPAKKVVKKKSPVKKTPVKKVVKKTPVKKTPVKKVVKKKVPVKTASVYSKKTVVALRALCKRRDIDADKCALVRDELIAVLEEYDALHADDVDSPKVVKSKVVKKKTPVKKVVKKKTPVKKVKKVARCDDVEDPLECDEGTICSAKIGKCVDEAKGKFSYKLVIDDRSIFGTKATITKLQSFLGGDIVPPAPKAKRGAVKKTPKPKEISIVFEDEDEDEPDKPGEIDITPDEEDEPILSPEEEEEQMEKYRKEIEAYVKKKEAGPKTVQGKLEDLLNEDPLEPSDVDVLKEQIKKMKTGEVRKTPEGPKVTPQRMTPSVASPPKTPVRGSTKVELAKQDLLTEFQKCLESLSV